MPPNSPGPWENPLWKSLQPLGRHPQTGGYRRYTYTESDAACRAWFANAAFERGLEVETDRNGNLWAWWIPPADGMAAAGGIAEPVTAVVAQDTPSGGPKAVVTGSHLDSVPDGGAFDGPLGVVSAFAAIDRLAGRGLTPARPVGVVAFAEEEGARFGLACLGSRLMTGEITPEAARALTDSDGITLAEAMSAAGMEPGSIGPDPERVSRIGAYVELHVEQGRALAPMDAAIGVAESIWPHGRWRIDFTGRADHAGTTRLADRRDPMLPYAATVLAARAAAERLGALATFGKVSAEPGGANAICSAVRAWLDARAPDEATLDHLVSEVITAAEQHGADQGVNVRSRPESVTPIVTFDVDLRDRVAGALASRGITAPVLATGAGHDAGVLAARLPAAMLFVRNPTGVSHSPAEHAEPEDCEAGVTALAAVLEELACR